MGMYFKHQPHVEPYPQAPNSDTANRWMEQRRRRRMLEGCWEHDLYEFLAPLIDVRRLDKWRRLDISKNLFGSLTSQLAVLYSRAPVVYREDKLTTDLQNLTEELDYAGLWQLAASNQQLTLGLREGAIMVHTYTGKAGKLRLSFNVIPADLFDAVASMDTPDEPHTFYWYRRRQVGDELKWTRDVYSIEDPEIPYFRVEDEDGNTLPQFESYSGENYTWRINGMPYIPAVVYHALRTGKMFDWSRGVELVDGSLQVAGLWTLWQHIVRDCSWPQRWAFNAELQGVTVKDGVVSIVTDPATLLNFVTKPGVTGSAGQFEPGGDPKSIGEAIQAFATDLASGFDLSPGDVKRVHGDARSGYAIEITKDGQREAQRKFAPSFSRADLQLLTISAALLGLRTEGWKIRYTGIPATFSERQSLIAEYKVRAELGLTSPVAVLAVLDDISEDEARKRLIRYAEDRALLATLQQPIPPEIPDARRSKTERDTEDATAEPKPDATAEPKPDATASESTD